MLFCSHPYIHVLLFVCIKENYDCLHTGDCRLEYTNLLLLYAREYGSAAAQVLELSYSTLKVQGLTSAHETGLITGLPAPDQGGVRYY